MYHKFKLKKLISLLLSILLILTMFPMTVLAAVTAQGTAETEAGTNKIYITLTDGKFAYQNAVGLISNWALGGASASANPIVSVQRNDDTHVSVYLTNLIMTSEEYTITALPAVFGTEVLPFSSPLQITVAPDAPPSFPAGYPKGGVVYKAGSRRLDVETGLLSEPSHFYFVVVANGAAKPTGEQIKAGLDSTNKPALYSDKTDRPTVSLSTNFSFPAAEDNTDYDFYFILKDATGNETTSGPLTLKTPPERTEPICIFNDEVEFTKIEEAISCAIESGGGTIKLLDHVYLNKEVVIDKPVNINFILNDFYLNIYTGHIAGSTALEVSNGANVTYTGNGGFYAAGAERGVMVIGSNSSAAVTYAESAGESGIAAAAGSGGSVTVNGDVYAGKWSTGVHASDGGTAVVNGNVYVTGDGCTGINVVYGGSVTVNGDIIAQKAEDTDGYLNGVYISIEEPVFFAYKSSISVAEASVIVNGNIIVEGNNSWGVFARGGSAVVNGSIDVEGTGSFGIEALDGGKVIVTAETGNAITMTGDYCYSVNAVEGMAAITGDIDAKGNECRGISAQYGSTVAMEGDIFFTGNQSYGVYAFGDGAVVTIDGNVYGNDDDEEDIEHLKGVYVGEYADVTVTDDVAVSGISSIGVFADDTDSGGGSATVEGSVYAEGTSCIAVKATGYQSIVTVKENVAASGDSSMGVYASGSSTVTVNVNVYQESDKLGGGGIYCLGDMEDLTTVTVDGTLTASYENDIKIGEGWRPQDSPGFGAPDPEKPGYIKYSDADDPEAIIWIGGNTVPDEKVPTVVTGTVSDVTTYSAIFSGEVTSDGGSPVTEQGFVYGTAANPDVISGITVNVSTGTSIFSAQVSDLAQNTTYHVRAYAVNDKGTAYGNDVSFKTGDTPSQPPDDSGSGSSRVIKLPTVVTEKISGITASDAMLSGNVTSDGGSEVTLRGFVYSTDSNPTIDTGIKVNAGKGTGAFNSKLTGLFSGTDYHVRAYAVNSKGTAYGKDVLFTTGVPLSGDAGYLDASGAQSPYGCVVLYTDPEGVKHIVGLSDVEGDIMKYISRGPGKYEIIFNAKPFDDIAGHWAKNDIDYCSARLLFDGVSPGIFAPDISVTRGMLTTVLGRMYGIDASLYSGHSFDDVSEEMYYAPYIKWAADNNIIYGVSDKLFEPERPVTRQEMASMLHRFMKFLGVGTEKVGETFADDSLIQDWARESVMSLQASGIINGKPGNLFDPDSSTTRAETAAMLRRMIEYILK